MQRRNADRDARLKAADAQAATLAAEAKRLEQQRAQLEAELAEAHRERCALPCPPPVKPKRCPTLPARSLVLKGGTPPERRMGKFGVPLPGSNAITRRKT